MIFDPILPLGEFKIKHRSAFRDSLERNLNTVLGERNNYVAKAERESGIEPYRYNPGRKAVTSKMSRLGYR